MASTPSSRRVLVVRDKYWSPTLRRFIMENDLSVRFVGNYDEAPAKVGEYTIDEWHISSTLQKVFLIYLVSDIDGIRTFKPVYNVHEPIPCCSLATATRPLPPLTHWPRDEALGAPVVAEMEALVIVDCTSNNKNE